MLSGGRGAEQLCLVVNQTNHAKPFFAQNKNSISTISFQLNEEVNQFQRKFVSEVKRCEEMDRKLRFIEAEIIKEGVKIPELTKNPEAPNPRQVVDLEVSFKRHNFTGWLIQTLV